jgi:hypothetical protein
MADVDEAKVVASESQSWPERGPWRLDEVLAIGASESDGVQFGAISGVDVAPDGTIFVAEKQAQEVLAFSPDGELLSRIGRAGPGPGEFGGNIGGVFVVGGELVVPDPSNQRVSRFALDGTFLDSDRLSAQQGVPLRWDLAADGKLVAQRRAVAAPDGQVVPDVVVTVGGPGLPVDTLRHLPPGQSVQVTGAIPIVRPFEPEPVWDTTAEGRLVTALSNARTFEVRGLDGQVEWVAKLPGQASRATSADRGRVEASVVELYSNERLPLQLIDSVVSRIEYGERLPAFASVAFGPLGSLWVQEIRTPIEPVGSAALVSPGAMGGREWSVVDREGHLLGRLTFPVDFQPIVTVDTTFYGVATDAYGTQSVRAFQVVIQ